MRKILFWAGSICLLTLILFSAVFLKWEALSYFAFVKAAQYYAARENITLEIGGISGNPFAETTIEKLSFRPEKEQPQAYHFEVEKLICTYNLWDLKIDYDLFLEGLDCTAESPEFSYDLSKLEHQKQADPQPELFVLPTLVPRLALSKGTVFLTGSGWHAEARDINSRLSAESSVPELYFQAGRALFNQEGITRIDTEISTLLHYTDGNLIIEYLAFGKKEISVKGTIGLPGLAEKHVDFTSELVFARNGLNVSGTLNNGLLQAHGETDSFDIGEIQRRLGGSGWDISGNIRGEANITYNFESKADLTGSFSLTGENGMVHGLQLQSASLAGKFDTESLHIFSAELRMRDNHIVISEADVPMGLLQTGDALAIANGARAEFEAVVNDHVSFLKFFEHERETLPEAFRLDFLTINGRLGKGSIYLDHFHAATPDSTLVMKNGIIPIPATAEAFSSVPLSLTANLKSSSIKKILTGLSFEFPLDGRLDTDLTLTGSVKEPRGAVRAAGDNLTYDELNLGSLFLQGELSLSQGKPGAIKSALFTASEITLKNDSGTMSLLSPAKVSLQEKKLSLEAAVRSGEHGEAFIVIDRTAAGGISGKVSSRNLDSAGWLESYINQNYFFEDADIEMSFSGAFPGLKVKITGSLGGAGQKGATFPMAGKFALDYSPRGIEITEFSWKSHENNLLTLKGFLPYDPLAETTFLDGQLFIDAHIDVPALEGMGLFFEPIGITRGALSMDMAITGNWKQPIGRLKLKAEDMEPPDILKQYSDASLNVACDISADPDAILLNSAILKSDDYTVQANGSWQHGFSASEFFQKRVAELRGDVSADASIDFKNLNFLKKKLLWLRRFDGETQAKLNIKGSVSEPVVHGSFSMKDGEMSHTFNFPSLSSINLLGEFDARSLTIKNMQGEVGGSSVTLSGRIIRGQQEDIDVSLKAEGKNVLLFRNNDLRLRGDVELMASGPLDRLAIKGTTGLTGGYYTKNVDFLGKIGASSAPDSKGGNFLFSFVEEPLKNATLDINITTIEPFKVRNNLVRGTLRPELNLKGTGELPFLVGTVYIDPSKVLLPSGRLQVQSGLLRFLESNPDRPQLDLLANSKVLGYDINVVSQGPIDDPVVTLSSSPPLPSDDLLLLLLTGQPPKQDTAAGTRNRSATNVMVYLGRDFLTKWLEEESGSSDDETVLDRFELDYGRAVTKSGEQTIESTFRLSKQEEGKNRVYYLSGEKDRYDAFNYGLRMVFRFE